MKTSKKLLIGLIGLIFLSTLGFLTYVRINIEGVIGQGTENEIDFTEGYVIQELEMEAFDKLTAEFRGRIYFYSTDNTYKIEIKTPESIANSSNLNISNIAGTLNIDPNKNTQDQRFCEVHIYAPTLQEIILKNVTRFEADRLSASDCNIEISSGHFTSVIDITNCKFNLKNGAMVTVEGNTDILSIESLNGSIFNGNGLTANTAKISAYEGSNIELDQINTLYFDIHQKTVLKIKGNPNIKQQIIESGAQFIKQDSTKN